MFKKQKGHASLGVLYLSLWVFGLIGWGMNLYKLFSADFEAPYKTEIIRTVAVPVFFVGAIAGYMHIGEEEKSSD